MYERYYCVNDLPKARQQRPSAPQSGIGRVVLSQWFIIKSQNRDAAIAKQWDLHFFVR
ncbi:hypothetical protein ACCS67_05665 [Rhizobium brockwellii]|uniref:hypothetical protein n=1 Tax=Rhizobium brockwellii TaxID=3019932 RepID=UPI003F99A584